MGDDTSTDPATVVIRYLNLSGALIAVTVTDHRDWRELRWFCQGCLDTDTPPNLGLTRTAANAHAGICRALPPTPPATA